MSDPGLVGLVQIRQTQIGAALGATGANGYALKPLVSVFGPELVKRFTLGSRARFPGLRVTTEAMGEFGIERLQKLLGEVYDADAKVVGFVGRFAEQMGSPAFRLTVEEPNQGVLPRIEVGFRGDRALMDAYETLQAMRIGDEAIEVYESTVGRLRVERVDEIAFVLPTPMGPPELAITFPWVFQKSNRDTIGRQLANAAEGVGVSARLCQWSSDMLETFAPREMNLCRVTIPVGLDAPIQSLEVVYPAIPSSLLLRLLGHLAPEDGNGARLGAMTAAVGMKEDVVSSLSLMVRGDEPPGVRFEIEAPGPPAVGDA
jgi:hypothetical protein